jgi:hypothetical protein
MVITTSLASGLAGRSFQQAMTEMYGVLTLSSQISKSQGLPTTPKGARKLLARLLPLVRQVSLVVREDKTRAYGPYITWLTFEPAGIDGSIALSKVIDAPLAGYREIEPVVRYSKHAVARGHQRLDEVLWDDVRREFLLSSPFAWFFYRAKERLPIRQAFLPTLNGVFAGKFDTDGRLYMQTYIRIDEASKRWQSAYALVGEAEQAFPSYTIDVLDAITLMRKPTQKLEPVVDWFINRLNDPEFQWLQTDYEARPDPIGEAWLNRTGDGI